MCTCDGLNLHNPLSKNRDFVSEVLLISSKPLTSLVVSLHVSALDVTRGECSRCDAGIERFRAGRKAFRRNDTIVVYFSKLDLFEFYSVSKIRVCSARRQKQIFFFYLEVGRNSVGVSEVEGQSRFERVFGCRRGEL